jgi:hypothetical protein
MEQEVSLTSKYDNTHHCMPEPLLSLGRLRQLHVRFPSLTSLQGAVSKLTALEVLRIEGLQGTLIVEPEGPRAMPPTARGRAWGSSHNSTNLHRHG